MVCYKFYIFCLTIYFSGQHFELITVTSANIKSLGEVGVNC